MLVGDAEYSYGGMVVYVEAAVYGIGGSFLRREWRDSGFWLDQRVLHIARHGEYGKLAEKLLIGCPCLCSLALLRLAQIL